jgi:hypothetical protein
MLDQPSVVTIHVRSTLCQPTSGLVLGAVSRQSPIRAINAFHQVPYLVYSDVTTFLFASILHTGRVTSHVILNVPSPNQVLIIIIIYLVSQNLNEILTQFYKDGSQIPRGSIHFNHAIYISIPCTTHRPDHRPDDDGGIWRKSFKAQHSSWRRLFPHSALSDDTPHSLGFS